MNTAGDQSPVTGFVHVSASHDYSFSPSSIRKAILDHSSRVTPHSERPVVWFIFVTTQKRKEKD